MAFFQPHPRPLPEASGRGDTDLRERLFLKQVYSFCRLDSPPQSFGEGPGVGLVLSQFDAIALFPQRPNLKKSPTRPII